MTASVAVSGRALILVCCFAALVTTSGIASGQTAATQQSKGPVTQTDPGAESSSDSGSSSAASIPADASEDHDNSLGVPLLKHLLSDQRSIWTSPFRIQLADADWLLPLGVAAGGMLATDTEVSKHLSNSPSRLKYSDDLSNYGLVTFGAAVGGLYLWGRITHDDHKREAGFLAGEAALDSLVVDYVGKYTLGRERPLQDDYRGGFWKGGDSFPSEHATVAWSIASVISHEYPGPLTTILAYGGASAITAARVTGKQHFPADVLIGSAIGWFTAEEVYRHRHDPELGGGDWPTYSETHPSESPTPEPPPGEDFTSGGSRYVELDSWIYPAIERLAALGYIHSEFLAMRPWTRSECARLVEEAGDEILPQASVSAEADQLYASLEAEFEGDINQIEGGGGASVRLESMYTEITDIDGSPLHDSYHFGQTIINNYGRPYEQGFNTYDGFSGYATAGRFTIYVRGEYQHSPFAPAYSLAAREAIAVADRNPLQPAVPFASTDQFRLLDTYVSATVSNWDLAFGKQSLWWGPADGGALMFSDNAEPIYMFRASRIAPFKLPWIFGWLGPMKLDFFFGKLSGNDFPARPLIHGEKISFKPTPNLAMSFTFTSELGGVGRPITPAAIFNSYFGIHSSDSYSPNASPGKRTLGGDFVYAVPPLRGWASLYAEALLPEDNPTSVDNSTSPVNAPRRAAGRTGIYLPRLPGVSKLDFRVEAVYTDPPTERSHLGQYVYFNDFYHDLYTNKGNIIADWIGREGMGFQGWTTYSFSTRSNLQFGYRHAKIAKDFIPQGETMNDASAKLNWNLRHDITLSTEVQYEKWLAPVLASTPQTDWTTSFGVEFSPRSWGKQTRP